MQTQNVNSTNNYWDASVTLSNSAKQFHDPAAITDPYTTLNPLDLTIFVSCFNEQEYVIDTLEVVISAMKEINKHYEIIVIDDNSKDNSVQLIKNFIDQHPNINIVLRANKHNKGLAQNYIDGAFIGRGKYYRLICGDNAEPFDTIVNVLKMMGKADIIIPYYTSSKGKSLYRRTVSRTYTWIINQASGYKINYYNGLQINLRYNVMRWPPNTRGFGFQASQLCLLLSLGFSYMQVPCITIERRTDGGTAITWRNIRSVIHTISTIFLRRLAP